MKWGKVEKDKITIQKDEMGKKRKEYDYDQK